ncbi:MAG: YdcF family protein [Simkaniaceae bacterium]|nr:YdcF family protein [Simkaniaceae bacterium]
MADYVKPPGGSPTHIDPPSFGRSPSVERTDARIQRVAAKLLTGETSTKSTEAPLTRIQIREDQIDEALAVVSTFLKKEGLDMKLEELPAFLLDPTRKGLNQKPRVEVREVSGEPVQLAIALKDSDQRGRFIDFMAGTGFDIPGFEKRQAGSTTVEMGVEGISKSSSINYLAIPEHFAHALEFSGYMPGSVIDARETQSIVIADADGTIWETPRSGEEPEARNLANSPTQEALLDYLRNGGVLAINSGNDPQRVARKILVGIPFAEREALLPRILIGVSGGNALMAFAKDGRAVEVPGYREEALTMPKEGQVRPDFDVIYLGDDGRARGNDMDAFNAVGPDRSICVSNLTQGIPDVAKKNQIYGKERAVAHVFRAISSVMVPGKPLFSDDNLEQITSDAKINRGAERHMVRHKFSTYLKILSLEKPESFEPGGKIFDTFAKEYKNDIAIKVLEDDSLVDAALAQVSLKPIEDEPLPMTAHRILLARLSQQVALSEGLQEAIESTYSEIDPATAADYRRRSSLEVRRMGPQEVPGLTLERDTGLLARVRRLHKNLSTYSTEQLKEVGDRIASAFQQPTVFRRGADGSVSSTRTTFDEEKGKEHDLIWINGNNDLTHVDRMANLYRSSDSNPPVIVSGFGGHGTSPGSIFSHTEADTMGAHFERMVIGKNPHVLLESKAENSGQNIQFSLKMLADKGLSPRNIVISGTPSAVLRQAVSFMAQSGGYEWDTITIVPPEAGSEEYGQYYNTKENATISMICALREVASFVDYSMSSPYLAPVFPDAESFKVALSSFSEMYEVLSGSPSPISDIDAFTSIFYEVVPAKRACEDAIKERKAAGEDTVELEAELAEYKGALEPFIAQIKPMAQFFRESFAALEVAHMEVEKEPELKTLMRLLAEKDPRRGDRTATLRGLDLA